MTKTVTIILKTDGTMVTEASGFVGASCMAETAKLIEDLCKTTVETKAKEEYYAVETEHNVSA